MTRAGVPEARLVEPRRGLKPEGEGHAGARAQIQRRVRAL